MVRRRVSCGAGWEGSPARGSSLGAQYSSARMIVSTRVVTAGSAGSGEPISVARS